MPSIGMETRKEKEREREGEKERERERGERERERERERARERKWTQKGEVRLFLGHSIEGQTNRALCNGIRINKRSCTKEKPPKGNHYIVTRLSTLKIF